MVDIDVGRHSVLHARVWARPATRVGVAVTTNHNTGAITTEDPFTTAVQYIEP
jgi:hypothetical protein